MDGAQFQMNQNTKINDYIDECASLECNLTAIANLLNSCTDLELIDEDTLSSVGLMILEITERQRILRHYFLGGHPGSVDESLLAGEKARLDLRHKKLKAKS